MTDAATALRRGSQRECDCPDYISRCTHIGDLRVWLVTPAGRDSEYERRTGEPLTLDGCVECGRRKTIDVDPPHLVGSVYGPGRLDPNGPECPCLVELLCPDESYAHHVPAGQSVDEAFTEAVARMADDA